MKLRITMPGRVFSAELEEPACGRIFCKMASALLESMAGEAPEQESGEEDREEAGADSEQEPPTPDDAGETEEKAGGYRPLKQYRGFLHLKCDVCGKVRDFCARTPISEYRCPECGEVTPLSGPIRRVEVNCMCGNRSQYQTNVGDYTFDINCIACGAPVAVALRPKKNRYETVKQEDD